jgi:hypothetical protein
MADGRLMMPACVPRAGGPGGAVMGPWQIASLVCYLIALVAYLFIVVAAFQDEVWKGIATLFCGFYGLYYAIKEWDHEYQWLVLAAMIGGGVLGRLIPFLAAMQQVGAM